MLAELYVLTGREAGKGITVSPGVPTIFVGRAATNHIRVRDPQASRVHCRVDVTADGLVLRDNNSGNGTFLNGERVDGSRWLEDGDEIELGETRIKVLIETPEERARWERGTPSDVSALEDSLSEASQLSSISGLAVVRGGGALGEDGRDDGPDDDDAEDELEVIEDDSPRASRANLRHERDEPSDDEVDDDHDEGSLTETAVDDVDRASQAEPPRRTRARHAPEPPRAPEPASRRRTLREVLPGYRIEARLGGHSRAGVAVYRAQQVSLERPVALKVLLARGPDRERDVQRFVREAKAIARLPHPNIVTIHDVLSRGTLRVIVMEHVAGGSLADVLEGGGALEPGAILRVGEAVAEALAYAHAHEVVHRNVKPSNVLYAPEMEAYKLGDFGLATGPGHARAGDTSFLELPATGLAFVPPELLQERHEVDPRSDVYALGATLYACAAGRPPFEGRTGTEIAAKVLRDDPAPLPDVPAPLWTLIRRAMAKDVAERYPDGAALLHEVRACQAGQSSWGAPRLPGAARSRA